MIVALNDLQILKGFMYNPLHFMSLELNLRLILEVYYGIGTARPKMLYPCKL